MRLMLALWILLPLIVISGLVARPRFSKMTPLPEEGRVLPLSMFKRSDQAGLFLRFEPPRKPTDRALMAVVPITPPEAPDVLVYWNAPGNQTGVPGEGSVLLGSLKSNQTRWFSVPIAVPQSGGSLIIYDTLRRRTNGSAPWNVAFADEGNR
jgi:hypothetical protein